MKKQTKSNLRNSLQSLGLIFLIFFAMAFACKDDEGSGGGRETNQNGQINDNRTTTNGGVPRSLNSTAWKIDFGKGVTGTTFLFCKGGKRWEIVPARAGTIGAVGKSYSVSGNTLTTVNADDGMIQNWKMTWEGDVLALNDGKVTLRLHYNGETQC